MCSKQRLLPLVLTLWAGLALRLLGLSRLPLVPDEAYYWLWSRRLDWSYFDHPSGTALLLRLSTALGGQSEFGIRWLNALLGTACVAVVWAISDLLVIRRRPDLSLAKGEPRTVMRGAAAFMVAGGAPYVVVSRFVYTDVLFLFLMLVNAWSFIRLSRMGDERADRGWAPYVAWGVSMALLLNTKYTALLYVGALGAWMLLRRHTLLRTRRFWVAALGGAAGFTPVAGWNAVHGWASFRWQLAHLVSASPGGAASGTLLGMWTGNVQHAVGYLTWPVALVTLAGGLLLLFACARRARTSYGAEDALLLGLAGLTQLLPAFLSPASSPRNLTGGIVFLVMGFDSVRFPQIQRARVPVLGSILALVALYGVGTVVALGGTATPFQSSVVRDIHRDVVGVEDLAATLTASNPAQVFAIDYGLAGQLSYYMNRTVHTSWGQYQLWGYPAFQDVTVVSLSYLPPALIQAQLRQAFAVVDGPHHLPNQSSQGHRYLAEVAWWRATGLLWTQRRFLDAFDYFTLAEQAP
jgi:4-amino-4-deoxy-L-arabinose transferase-like glycosyltransferase